MEEKIYYISPSTGSTSGLSKLANELESYASGRYCNTIASYDDLKLIESDLKGRAVHLHSQNPRCKQPEVSLTESPYQPIYWLRIDEWSVMCKETRWAFMEGDEQ